MLLLLFLVDAAHLSLLEISVILVAFIATFTSVLNFQLLMMNFPLSPDLLCLDLNNATKVPFLDNSF